MKVANLETKRKKNYTPELYFDVIEEIKRQYGDGIFREKPDLFAQVAALMGGDTAEKKAKRRRETNIANLNKRKDVKPLPVWTERRVSIQKPESQAIKNCILELGRKVVRFTRAFQQLLHPSTFVFHLRW